MPRVIPDQTGKIVKLLDAEDTAATAGTAYVLNGDSITVQAVGSTTAATGAASVKLQVSLDNTNWVTAGTISLTLGIAATTDGFALAAPWAFVRGYLDTISGTGATVTLYAGV